MRFQATASQGKLIAVLQLAAVLMHAGASVAQQSSSRSPNRKEADHVRLSSPVVQAWREIQVGSPVYALDDAVGAKDWLSKGSPQPRVYRGIVFKVNGTLSVDDLLKSIRGRTTTIKIDEYDVFGADSVSVQRYSRPHDRGAH